jgi:Do/DeqQ family serine protease
LNGLFTLQLISPDFTVTFIVMKKILLISVVLVASAIGAVIGALVTLRFSSDRSAYNSIVERQQSFPVRMASDSSYRVPAGLNFETAARLVTPAVVHIRTVYGPGNFSLNPLELLNNPHAQSSGSGVIITDDGYIVTNYHVIEDGSSIEVIMNNNRHFYAKVVGTDPTTDLALLKIKGNRLPFVRYGDSDDIAPGQWVLAIGNPFDLNSTVTAGIVSARARNIGILHDRINNLQIESFIQTDAAVNPGNSGGALVNLKGELIGINSAIATATGGYAGYSFAIPESLVRKIMDDLLEFGQVQRGLLGVQITDVDARLAERQNLSVVQGIYVSRVNEGSAAEKSGLLIGDVIIAIDGHTANSVSELQEQVARHRPGHSVKVKFIRQDKEKQVTVILKSYEGSLSPEKKEPLSELEGAQFENVSYQQLRKLNIDEGVAMVKLGEGKWKKAGVKVNFVVMFIDKVPVENTEDINRIMANKSGGVLVEGIYPNREKAVYAIEW